MKRTDNLYYTKHVPTLLYSVILSGCMNMAATTPDAVPYGTQLPIIPLATPVPVRTIETFDKKTNKRVETDVLSMKSSEIRKRLTNYETFTTIQRRDLSGRLSYVGNSVKAAKGSYVITFDYVNSSTQEIVSDTLPGKALGQIGVGLRITAEITTFTNDVDIGGLMPIGIAFKDNKVSGSLRFKAFGLSNDKVATLIPADVQSLDVSGIQKAFEAAATVRLLISLDETNLEPNLIGVTGVAVNDSQRALDAARSQLATHPLQNK
ncbi:hypothetical protein [Pseudomonas kurunegalensis]|uniref:hypothetical protein n=1 Tax=Pseudomonas kurunegalensis TaxID=485880 RepID=UPI00236379FF|nr:hypothetical protein [Pseudomonas kurunegalensis]MDD2133454.1 hypothetical protein [Pseudomonas kurunegalensis]